jgi:hypothetical protein
VKPNTSIYLKGRGERDRGGGGDSKIRVGEVARVPSGRESERASMREREREREREEARESERNSETAKPASEIEGQRERERENVGRSDAGVVAAASEQQVKAAWSAAQVHQYMY